MQASWAQMRQSGWEKTKMAPMCVRLLIPVSPSEAVGHGRRHCGWRVFVEILVCCVEQRWSAAAGWWLQPTASKGVFGSGEPQGILSDGQDNLIQFILLAQWNYMSKVSKVRPSSYDVCDLGVLMGITEYRLAFSFTAYSWPHNSQTLQHQRKQHFDI